MKIKLKGTYIEELPEVEIEAMDREEAEEKYNRMYLDGKINVDKYDILFDDNEEDEDEDDETEEEEDLAEQYGISNERWDEMPRIVKGKNGEEFVQDIFKITPLKDCKIYGLKEEEMFNEVWDSLEYTIYYLDKGYFIYESGKEGTKHQFDNLYKRKIDKEQKKLI